MGNGSRRFARERCGASRVACGPADYTYGLRENAPRKGFIEEKEYRQLCEKCTEHWLRAMLALAYTFGFRKSELLRMRLNHVDLLNRSLSLEPGTTRND